MGQRIIAYALIAADAAIDITPNDGVITIGNADGSKSMLDFLSMLLLELLGLTPEKVFFLRETKARERSMNFANNRYICTIIKG